MHRPNAKRWLDPKLRRGGAPIITDLIAGARPVVDAARAFSKFDYDRPIEGLRALDRYTLQLKLAEVNYPNIEDMLGFVGAVAREVVEAAGGDIRTRAVGTGPYKLREWKRGSRIVLEANPRYRTLTFPESDQPEHAALVRSMRGKSFPQAGVIEINVIDEDLTRLLQFEQNGLDYIVLRAEVANRLLAEGKLKPEYAARGVTRQVYPEPYIFSLYFNMVDPLLGGMSKLAEYDKAAEQFLRSGMDAEQIAMSRKMSELARTYMPELPVIFRLENDFVQPWVLGFRPQRFATYWKYLDIDLARRQAPKK